MIAGFVYEGSIARYHHICIWGRYGAPRKSSRRRCGSAGIQTSHSLIATCARGVYLRPLLLCCLAEPSGRIAGQLRQPWKATTDYNYILRTAHWMFGGTKNKFFEQNRSAEIAGDARNRPTPPWRARSSDVTVRYRLRDPSLAWLQGDVGLLPSPFNELSVLERRCADHSTGQWA